MFFGSKLFSFFPDLMIFNSCEIYSLKNCESNKTHIFFDTKTDYTVAKNFHMSPIQKQLKVKRKLAILTIQ